MANFEAIALKHLLEDGIEIIPELHKELFTDRYSKLYLLCLDYFDSNKKLPTLTELKAIVESKAPLSVKPQYLATVDLLAKLDTEGIDVKTTISELKDQKVLRDVDTLMVELVEAQRDKDSTKVRQLLNKLNEKVNLRGLQLTDFSDAKDSDEEHSIVPSFLGKDYEHLIGGGHTGLVIYGAASGGGKSILLLQTAINNYLAGNNVLFVSLELPRSVLYKRLVSHITGIDFTRINSKELTEEEIKECSKAHDQFFSKSNKNWFKIIDDSVTDGELTNIIAVKSQLDNLHTVCIDYLNLVEIDTSDDWKGLSRLAKKLHRLTRTHGVCIVSAAQINSEGKTKGSIVPNISTRGSKELEFSASQFFFVDIEQDTKMLVNYTKKNRIARPKHFIMEPDFAHMAVIPTDIVLEE